jgi:hypothetical protein
MEDELCMFQKAHATVREPPATARQMRIPEEEDQETPLRKRPSRYTSSPSA